MDAWVSLARLLLSILDEFAKVCIRHLPKMFLIPTFSYCAFAQLVGVARKALNQLLHHGSGGLGIPGNQETFLVHQLNPPLLNLWGFPF